MRTIFSKYFLYALLLSVFFIETSTAQDDFAFIRKNVNALANSLKHDLCKTKDTLILKGREKIGKIYTIGEHSGLINDIIFDTNYRLPLTNLEPGKYVFAVSQSGKKIIFEVTVLKDSRLNTNRVVANRYGATQKLDVAVTSETVNKKHIIDEPRQEK